jgi:hypothetical protein
MPEDDEEAHLRKEALAAQAEYYRLKSAELALDMARKEQRRDAVKEAAATAGNVAASAGRGALTLAKGVGAILAAIVVWAIYARANETTSTPAWTPPSDTTTNAPRVAEPAAPLAPVGSVTLYDRTTNAAIVVDAANAPARILSGELNYAHGTRIPVIINGQIGTVDADALGEAVEKYGAKPVTGAAFRAYEEKKKKDGGLGIGPR